MSFNKIILEGRLGADPELREINENSCVANFRIAVNRKYVKDKDHPVADWFTCEAWNGLAKTIQTYFHKGSRILISGRLENNVVDRDDGTKVTYATVKVEDFTFIDSKTDTTPANTTPDNTIPYGTKVTINTADSNINFHANASEDEEFPF